MYSVMLLDDAGAFMTHIENMSVWERYADVFKLRYLITDSAEAMNILSSERVDILISNIKTPSTNGIELLKHIRRERLCPVTILYSESADFGCARRAFIYGAFDYLVKPIENDTLEDVLIRASAYLADNPNSNPKDTLTQKADRVVQCLAEGGNGLDVMLSELFDECLNGSGSVLGKHMLENAAVMIHRGITDKFGWIGNIISDCGHLRRRISYSENAACAKEVVSEFCKEILDAVKTFYPSGMSRLVEGIVKYILAHSFEKLALEDVAEACFVNRTHLSHTFKKQMGTSFVDYITEYKMQTLIHLMNYTDMKLSQIAEKLGYVDYKYMGRVFKERYGMTPSEYKKSHPV